MGFAEKPRLHLVGYQYTTLTQYLLSCPVGYAPCILQENPCSAFWQQESSAARSLDLVMSRPAKSPGRSCPTPLNRDEMNWGREISLSLCPSGAGSSFWKTPVLNGGGQIFSELFRVEAGNYPSINLSFNRIGSNLAGKMFKWLSNADLKYFWIHKMLNICLAEKNNINKHYP